MCIRVFEYHIHERIVFHSSALSEFLYLRLRLSLGLTNRLHVVSGCTFLRPWSWPIVSFVAMTADIALLDLVRHTHRVHLTSSIVGCLSHLEVALEILWLAILRHKR